MTYCVDVITADASKLKNRGLAYAFTSSPYIITAFAGAKAAEGFYEDISWRWGFGAFAIIFPVVAAPLYFILKANLRKAKKDGTAIREKSDRTVLQSIWFYIVEFDGKSRRARMVTARKDLLMPIPIALGVFLFSAGLTIFLLPFHIADAAPDGWASGYIIAMLVVGFVLLVAFGLYEGFVAPTPMLNFTYLTNRTVVGACLLDATYQIAYYCWANYFTSFLQVVNDLSIAEAGYVNNTFNVVLWRALAACRLLDPQDGPLQVAPVHRGASVHLRAGPDDPLPPAGPKCRLPCHVPGFHLHRRKHLHHHPAAGRSRCRRPSAHRRGARSAVCCWHRRRRPGRYHLRCHLTNTF